MITEIVTVSYNYQPFTHTIFSSGAVLRNELMDNLSTMIDCENCCSWTVASYELERLHIVESDEVSKLPLILLKGVNGDEELVVAYGDRIIWSRYPGSHSSTLPSDFKTFSLPASFNHILWTSFEFDKPSEEALVVINDGLLCSYSFSGTQLLLIK